ncbi:MAG: Uncharacterised protein [Cryomorphaceae bacterium]|nr:MAG: Uncharacterised protein [Cryomorphaceae bacterium]
MFMTVNQRVLGSSPAGFLRAAIDVNANGDVSVAGAGLVGLENYSKDSRQFLGDIASEATSLVLREILPLDAKVKSPGDVEGMIMNGLADFLLSGLSDGFGIAMKQSLKDTQDHLENTREDYNCENCLNEVVVIAPKK